MSVGNWKITIVGGSSNGMDYTFPANREVLIGRSGKADVRLSEADVSGRHLRLAVSDGVPTAFNLSTRARATHHNGAEMVPERGEAAVAAGDAVELGQNRGVRIRFDEVPAAEEASFVGIGEETLSAPGAAHLSSTPFSSAPTAVIEESAVTSPDDGDVTFATRAPDTFATRAPLSGSASLTPADDGETVLMSDSGMQFPPASDADTMACDPEEESGATRDLETRQGDMAEILALKKDFEGRRKRKYVWVTMLFLLVVGGLAGLWFVSRPPEDFDMPIPLRPDGQPDIATYAVRDPQGGILVKVDFPRDDGMSVTVSPDSNGVSVVSCMGRGRDVPFFLQLEAVSRADELEKDLLSSVRAWIARAEESGAGYVFDVRVKDELKFQFMEDVFPGSCQEQSLYGVKFVTFDYKRTWQDGELWHGVLIYFRRGDTAYVHRREIPERYWVRGGYRIVQDPNIAIYSNFIDSYWESPGRRGLSADRSVPELMESIRGCLARERASDWRFVKREIDAVLARTWRTDPKTRDLAEGCLRQFREALRTFYYGKYNAFQTAKENHDDRRMSRFRSDAAMVFDDPGERYYHLVGNGEVW